MPVYLTGVDRSKDVCYGYLMESSKHTSWGTREYQMSGTVTRTQVKSDQTLLVELNGCDVVCVSPEFEIDLVPVGSQVIIFMHEGGKVHGLEIHGQLVFYHSPEQYDNTEIPWDE